MDSPDAVSTPPQPRFYEDEEEDEEEEDDDESGDDVDAPDEDEDDDEEDEDEEDDEEGTPSRSGAGGGDGTSSPSALVIRASPTLDELTLYDLREIGGEAVCWSLSSAKPGNGVEQIRDTSNDTYWQSDGSQPHYIQVQFARRVAVSHVCLYLDYNLDESYTPKRLSVQVGMTVQDLVSTVLPVELHEPVGWCIIPLTAPPDPLDAEEEDKEENGSGGAPVRTFLVQISILSMHQNGRDTHIRQVKLFGPRRNTSNAPLQLKASSGNNTATSGVAADGPWTCGIPSFQTVEMSQFSTIR